MISARMGMGDAGWWYEWEGRQEGPVDEAALLELVRSGRLRAEARVWCSGMAGWEPLRAVPIVAAALPTATTHRDPLTPPLTPCGRPSSLSPTGGEGGWPSAALPEGMEPTSTAAVLGLGFLTLGIYPAVKFYQAGVAYQALTGRASRFTTWFWLSIALGLFGAPLHALGGVPGILCHIA
ncbi:MAG TPA: DUF4339 domain-containing protein, partial [Anaeromyxobacteraceae bacterium]